MSLLYGCRTIGLIQARILGKKIIESFVMIMILKNMVWSKMLRCDDVYQPGVELFMRTVGGSCKNITQVILCWGFYSRCLLYRVSLKKRSLTRLAPLEAPRLLIGLEISPKCYQILYIGQTCPFTHFNTIYGWFPPNYGPFKQNNFHCWYVEGFNTTATGAEGSLWKSVVL